LHRASTNTSVAVKQGRRMATVYLPSSPAPSALNSHLGSRHWSQDQGPKSLAGAKTTKEQALSCGHRVRGSGSSTTARPDFALLRVCYEARGTRTAAPPTASAWRGNGAMPMTGGCSLLSRPSCALLSCKMNTQGTSAGLWRKSGKRDTTLENPWRHQQTHRRPRRR